ncbi:deoxynucleoside-5'-monophosphatase [Vibrio phage phi 3]|uniref:Deoxynucleoside-5'-monophosphatase n=1 Tax=Vibrio phage phi 3 TaxID=1589298 RepID=A0A0B5HAK8_9CAUD|nr:deoxynucleoside-5'-monophosphatase [Vibrio phage phi 3]YP_009207611.1 deoxynucleoside-5'-monophosphatase [Vibrio phage phi 3]AJF40769.1 deoxynucleoside-5'-monophosphatase [Vibrio phage phi 3]AJF40913.1 deoxynucleoside-5'-monophosphatase [Vibrio phage phi 3]
MKKKIVYMFDLDQTVINSDHRVDPCKRPNGDLDLAKYVAEACTHEKIMGDSLLPLAEYMRKLIAEGETVITVTARHCGESDYYYLRKNGLRANIHLSRDRLCDVFGIEQGQKLYGLGDAEYKRAWFEHVFKSFPNAEYHLFDDHNGVLREAANMGITVIDAKILNQVLEMQLSDMYRQGEEDTVQLYESLIEDALTANCVLFPEFVDNL